MSATEVPEDYRMKGLRDIERKLNDYDRLLAENVALRNFLQIALDVHDDHFGVTNSEKYPKNWDVQARKLLSTTSPLDQEKP